LLIPPTVDFDRPDAVYDYETNLWSCCGTDAKGELNCSDPSNETFFAPSPEELVASFSVPISGWSATSTSFATPTISNPRSISATTRSVTTTSTTPSTSEGGGGGGNVIVQQSSTGSISSGAAAGIGVGSGIGVLAIGIAIWFCLAKQRRNKRDGKMRRFLYGKEDYSTSATKRTPVELEQSAGINELANPAGGVVSPLQTNVDGTTVSADKRRTEGQTYEML
jgi:hypothetical protein